MARFNGQYLICVRVTLRLLACVLVGATFGAGDSLVNAASSPYNEL